MKRSEALEQIRKILELNRIDNGMGEVEEAILHTLESIGMKPPLTIANPFDFTNTGFTQEFLDEHEFKVNRWELEDEA
jgi:hypothetical protein